MADPFTIAAIGGTIVAGIGAIQTSMYSSAVAEANAENARNNSQLALDIAGQDAEDLGAESAGFVGAQVASQGASGVSVNSPSAVRSRTRATDIGYQNQLRRIEGGERESANFRTDANAFDAEASAHKTSAGLSAVGTVFGAASSYLGGASSTTTNPFSITPRPVSRPRFYAGA